MAGSYQVLWGVDMLPKNTRRDAAEASMCVQDVRERDGRILHRDPFGPNHAPNPLMGFARRFSTKGHLNFFQGPAQPPNGEGASFRDIARGHVRLVASRLRPQPHFKAKLTCLNQHLAGFVSSGEWFTSQPAMEQTRHLCWELM